MVIVERLGREGRLEQHLVRERERRHELRMRGEVQRGADARGVPVLLERDHLPVTAGREHAVDRQPVLVAVHERRAGRQPHVAPVDRIGEAGQPVRPRVQERDAHDGALLDICAQPRLAVEQLLPLVAQRDAHHPAAGHEGRLEIVDRQLDRVVALEVSVVDSHTADRTSGSAGRHRPEGMMTRTSGASTIDR